MDKIYFDYASTTPADPEVVKAMQPYFSQRFGNPSSPHVFGREAKKAVEDSRETLAGFLGARPQEIIFTSGGTESNNHAIFGMTRSLKKRGNHVIVSRIEHHSVHEPVFSLEKEGLQVTTIDVDQDGRVDPGDIKKAVTDKTVLIAVMQASNEIGTIQPIAEIGKIAREKDIPFHVDAVQAVGHILVDVNALSVDSLSLSAHKLYGPKGTGAFYIREGSKVSRFLLGGGQERGLRASTENVGGIVGLAKAITLCQEKMEREITEQTKLRNFLIGEVMKRIDGVRLNGHLGQRLPNNAHFSFEKVQGEELLMSLDMLHIAASMGSACASGALEPSHVLRAIGLPDDLAFGSLRITIGRWTTKEHIEYFLEQLPEIIQRLRA